MAWTNGRKVCTLYAVYGTVRHQHSLTVEAITDRHRVAYPGLSMYI